MTRRAMFLFAVGALLLLAGAGLVVKVLFFSENNGPAALQINSFPKADVFINDAHSGQTPYASDKLTAGDYVVKLVASANGQTLTWIGKVKLTADTLTYVNRELGPDNDSSAGEILSLERLSGDGSAIAIISDPSGASVKLDGQDTGNTPLTVKDTTPSDHEIVLSLLGYRDRFIRGKTMPGFRLNVIAQLAKTGLVVPTASSSATPAATASGETSPILDKPYVVIKTTPTGWLRVRVSPSTAATESAKVNTGDKFPLLDQQPGWVKIRYQGANAGWVSDTYVDIVK